MESKSIETNLDILSEQLNNDFVLDIKSLHPIQQGFVNEVYLAQKTNSEEIIVRIAKGRNAYPVEIWAYKQFKQLGIPSPEVIDYQENPINIKFPTMIMEKATGTALSETVLNSDQKNNLYFQVGKILEAIHQIKISGYGFLVFKHEQLVGDYATAREHWESQDTLKHLQYLLEHKLVDDSQFLIIINAYQAILGAEVPQPVFIYNDLHKTHIFTDTQNITGVIDIGNSFSGDPRYDIASTLFFLEPDEQKPFKKGYGNLAEDPMVMQYQIMITALKTGWRHKAGNTEGAQKALSKLNRLLAKS